MQKITPLLALLLVGGLCLPASAAFASDGFQQINTNAILGGAIGGGAGAAVGSAMGGRNGAIIGGAIGAAGGVVIATPQRREVREYHEYDDRHEYDRHRGHHQQQHHEHEHDG